MQMLNFTKPLFLLLALFLPFYAWAKGRGFFRRFSIPITLRDWREAPPRLQSTVHRFLSFVSVFLLSVSWILLSAAAAGPVVYHQEPVWSGGGNPVIFALDISPSMAALDMDGLTRFESARTLIRGFVGARGGDSFGLVALGSDAALLVPPTRDHALFLGRLDSLRIGELGEGTALGLALAVAVAHLGDTASDRATVVLLTDGENNAGSIHPHRAARLYPERGINLHVVGIGSRGTVPLSWTDPLSGTSYSGLLESDFDEAALRSIADEAGGSYTHATSRDALERIFASLEEAVPPAVSRWSRTVEEPLEYAFVVVVLICASLAWFLRRVVAGAIL